MKPPAHDFHTLLVGLLQHLGPDAIALGLHAFPSWYSMRLLVGTDAAVSMLAASFGLDAPTIERAGKIAWTQATGEEGRLRVIVTGPHAIESDPGGTVGSSSRGVARGTGRHDGHRCWPRSGPPGGRLP